jgi:hypothetical protein
VTQAHASQIVTGVDPDGRLVLHGPSAIRNCEVYVVEWPMRSPLASVPSGTRIVADGALGDRPVYLTHPDGRVTPLPAAPGDPTAQWNFGYAGGGSSALEVAIASALGRADGVHQAQMPHNWIQDQVTYASKDRLEISVDELRRRYQIPADDDRR